MYNENKLIYKILVKNCNYKNDKQNQKSFKQKYERQTDFCFNIFKSK
jgi:hypothetical protein